MPLVSISTDSPSSGVGGPPALNVLQRRIAGNHHALDGAAGNMVLDPCPHVGRGKHRPQPLHHRHRHAGAGDAERQMRLGAGIIQAAGDGDADIVRRPRIDAAEIALIEIDALAHRIDARANRRPVDGDAFLVGRPRRTQDDRIDHRIAARHVEQPRAGLVGGASSVARMVN